MVAPAIVQRQVVARDGTRIGYQVSGDGPPVVLANGLGGTYLAFHYLYEQLGDYKVICWDYRGLYSSGAPADPRANTMTHQVDDLMAILEAERVDQFVIAGWSMGVQVAFETIKRHPSRVRGLFAINGTFGRAFRTVMGSRLVGQTIPMLLRLVRAQAALAGRVTKRVAGSDALISAM
jgi:pimeloyl-ACP methyl ester carboxylesterase